MIFEESDPDDAAQLNWGCPTYSEHAGCWMIRWFRASKSYTGSSVAKGDALEWIKANPEAVALSQKQLQTWLQT